MYVYPVTNETKWDKVPNVPPEEMGTNHPLSITRGLSPVTLSLCLFVQDYPKLYPSDPKT